MSSGNPRLGRAVVPFALMAAVSACAQPSAPAPGSAATAVAASKAASAVTAEPPVRLAPVAEARPSLMTSISISSLDRLLGAGTALVGRAVPLPLDPVGVRDMLLSQAGLSPAVGENLDFASPAGAALVSLGPKMEPGLVMAIAAKGVAEAQKVADALGKVVARRGQAFQIDNGAGGKGWIWISGNVLVLSDSVLALERGAMLALEARRTAPEEVTAVLYPEAIARANGTDVKAGLARVLDRARAGQVASGQSTEGVELLADLLGYVADASTIEIGLVIDTSRGLAIRAG